MITSLALIIIVGLSMAAICQKIKLPRIIGMLITGIVLGPFVLDLLDPSILAVSGDLRKIALIIILIKAGLSLDISDLKKVGRPAVLLSFVPASFEIIAYCIFAPLLLGVNVQEALLMGAVLSAVSPAVVVPRMVNLIESKYGTKKSIPQMILAGASCDDIFVIVIFSSFLEMTKGNGVRAAEFLNIPISIVLGIGIGIVFGFILSFIFEFAYTHGNKIRNSTKVILVLGFSFLLMAIETWVKGFVSVSGLLAVVSMACVVKIKAKDQKVSKRLSEKFGKLWIAAEILLFVLVGAAVDIKYAAGAGAKAVLMIFIALLIRSVGVVLCLVKTELNVKERIFCVLSYLPKATVQAAIGSVPLAAGLACGNIILSVAVMAIIITAPVGAISMDLTYKRLLCNDREKQTEN